MAPGRSGSRGPVDAPVTWRDPKRYLWLLGLVVPALAFVALGGWWLSGSTAWFWVGPVVVLGIVPVVDLVTRADPSNPPEEVLEALEADRYYRWVTYAFLPLQYLGFAAVLAVVGLREDLSVLDRLGLAATLGVIGGVGINTAHELGHKRPGHERWLARVALAPVFYGHFYIEHNRGHHVRVATHDDPASARLGESFFRFWPRTVLGSLRSGWRLERRRLARRGHRPLRWGNDLVTAWLMSVLLWGLAVAALGWSVLPFLVVQALVGISLLEAVNYLEHYGLLRQVVGVPGKERPERVDPRHSWNSDQIATNILLYHLQRHSDHHANPTRRYQTLRHFEESPVLPTGYAGMILLALVPPLWRRVMDPLVVAHYGGDVRLANLHPAARSRLLRRHAGPPAAPARVAPGTPDPSAGSDDGVLAARCPGCGYTYEVAAGNELEGFPAGTPWSEVPDHWCCPDCGVREKVDFEPLDPAGRG